MRMDSVSVFGKSVSIYESGEKTSQAILLIHGNSVDSTFQKPLICQLESDFYVITLDLPGHLHSDPWDKELFSRESFGTLFRTVLQKLNVHQTSAFGFSMGGFLLLECFDLIPEIKKLAINGHPPLQSVADMPAAHFLNDDSSLFLQGYLGDDEIERIYNSVVRINDQELKLKIKESMASTSPSFREGCLKVAMETRNQVEAINNSDVPVALILGSNDPVIRIDYLNNLKIKNLWNKKIQIIQDCGHYTMVEKPKELASVLSSFFKDDAL